MNSLPVEILSQINLFAADNYKRRKELSRVSKKFNAACNDEDIWASLYKVHVVQNDSTLIMKKFKHPQEESATFKSWCKECQTALVTSTFL